MIASPGEPGGPRRIEAGARVIEWSAGSGRGAGVFQRKRYVASRDSAQRGYGALQLTKAKKSDVRMRRDKEASFSLSNHPFYLINQIFLARGREINRDLARFDLDYQRWRVLGVLNEFPDCTMQFLSDMSGVDRTTLTHTVRLMTEKGLVARTERATDRRSVVLSLTGKGRKTLFAILPAMIALNDRCFAGFSATEVSQFMNHLRRIFMNLRGGTLSPEIANFLKVGPADATSQPR